MHCAFLSAEPKNNINNCEAENNRRTQNVAHNGLHHATHFDETAQTPHRAKPLTAWRKRMEQIDEAPHVQPSPTPPDIYLTLHCKSSNVK